MHGCGGRSRAGRRRAGLAGSIRRLGHLYFDSVDAFQAAFGPHADAIIGDIPNYTNVQPIIQINEVKIASEPPRK